MKKYLAVYEQIKNSIITGAYRYGHKIPSKRVTAENMGSSLVTVEHAYDILVSEGYIRSEERSGYYVTYRVHETFIGKEVEEQPLFIDEESKEHNTAFPFSVLSSAVRSVLNDYGEKLLEKSPNSGILPLKRAIRNYLYRNRGVIVDEKRIIIGSGSEYLYSLIIELLGLNRIYGIESPSYEKIENVYTAGGATCDRLKLGKDGILSSELQRTKATLLHVTPYRSYPTGVTATISKKKEYLSWAKVRNAYIVEDDYESEFSLTGKIAETIFGDGKSENVIYVNTFSKTISPAIRVGYMLLPGSLTKKYYDELGFYSCTVPVLEQYLIAKLLNDGSFERHLNRVRRRLKNKKTV